MKTASMIALGAVLLGTALTAGTPAKAAVGVSIGVAAPSEECVRYRVRPHRVVARYAYCGQPEWTGDPVLIGGVSYRTNVHYRLVGGHREFWVRGGWHRPDRDWDDRHRDHDHDHH